VEFFFKKKNQMDFIPLDDWKFGETLQSLAPLFADSK
jgi:hypothetical protein